MFRLIDLKSGLMIGGLTVSLAFFSFVFIREPHSADVPTQLRKRVENPFSQPVRFTNVAEQSVDSPEAPPQTPIDSLTLLRDRIVGCEYGVKSLLMSPDKTKLYSVNLEGLSLYEYDRANRKLLRKLQFHKTKSKGYDYEKKVEIESFEEKPVEGYITHNGRYLWTSLHNGGCLTVWDLKSPTGSTYVEGRPYKVADIGPLIAPGADKKGVFDFKEAKLLSIPTGKTPKIIAGTPDGKYLFVTNWHSNNTSVIKIESPNPKDWVKVRDLPNGAIPRGLAVSADSKLLYVAIMGGASVQVFDLATFAKVKTINVGAGPRHLVLRDNFLYISLNAADEIVKYDLNTQKIVKRAKTGEAPRTVSLSEDGRLLFVCCYKSEQFQVFSAKNFKLLGTFECKGNPVGVEAYQDEKFVEAWVCNYTAGNIKLFEFQEAD